MEPLATVAVGEPANRAIVPVALVVRTFVRVRSLTSEVLAAEAAPARTLMTLLFPLRVMSRSMLTVPLPCTVTLPVPVIALALGAMALNEKFALRMNTKLALSVMAPVPNLAVVAANVPTCKVPALMVVVPE